LSLFRGAYAVSATLFFAAATSCHADISATLILMRYAAFDDADAPPLRR